MEMFGIENEEFWNIICKHASICPSYIYLHDESNVHEDN